MPEISDSEFREFSQYKALGGVGEIQKKISDLESDNHKYREERRQLKEEQEGKVLVPEEDAKLLTQYRELGELKELSTRLEEGANAGQRLKELQSRSAALDFARAVGLAEESVDTMIAIPGLNNASYEVKTKKVKNEKGEEVEQTVGYIKLPDSDKAMSFSDAQEAVPALRGLRLAEPEKSQGPQRQRFIQQKGQEGGDDKNSLYERIRQEEQQRQRKRVESAERSEKTLDERMGLSPRL